LLTWTTGNEENCRVTISNAKAQMPNEIFTLLDKGFRLLIESYDFYFLLSNRARTPKSKCTSPQTCFAIEAGFIDQRAFGIDLPCNLVLTLYV